MEIPEIGHEFVCIIDRDQPTLAAVIISYLAKVGRYLPVFEFPSVTATKPDEDEDEDQMDEHYITRTRSSEFDVRVGNALAMMGGCEHLILGGISPEQKSFLTFLEHYNVIEIADVSDVDFSLSAFHASEAYIHCRSEEIWEGLLASVRKGVKLKLDEAADPVCLEQEHIGGMFIIEKVEAVSSVIGVNYALAVNADITMVPPLEEDEEREVVNLIEEWQNGSSVSYDTLTQKITRRLLDVDLTNWTYATFFTEGLPYSLITKNAVPCTYVHLLYRIDFFIFNSLFFEKQHTLSCAVVFSPEFFDDEETRFVIDTFNANHLYVRELLGENATVYNIDMHIKQFPFEVMHICSHGGEVGGHAVKVDFVDRDGNSHTVEYDEVVSFAPKGDSEQIPVHFKYIWRIFDGMAFKSHELKVKNFPRHVFVDMFNAVGKSFKENTQLRAPKNNIPNSCSIRCKHFVYQGMFDQLAGNHTAPLIFNNSCWSWSGIAENFLAGGVRGYIGTMWAVNTDVATKAAKIFYKLLFTGTVLNAFHRMQESTKASDSENIYIYWGLHFSSVQKEVSIRESRENVCHSLLTSFYRWNDKLEETRSEATKKLILELRDWNMRELKNSFFWEYFRLRKEMLLKYNQQK